MLCGEVTVVYCENHMKQINTLCDKKKISFTVNLAVHTVTAVYED
jgi:hypothetical protein